MWGAIASAASSFAGSFLSGVTGGAAQGIGAGIGASLYGNKRVSSGTAQHNEILLDRHQANQNQRDIRTTHEMLPSQAMAHNYMRDNTFHQDTAAMDRRNQELFYDKIILSKQCFEPSSH